MKRDENKPVKSKKDAFSERLRAKYPESNFDQEEDFFGRVNEDYDDYERRIADNDKRIADYEKRESELSEMFMSDPRSANFLTNWRKGKHPAVELVRQFGHDIKDAIDDPERLEEIEEANKEFLEKVAKEKELEEMYKTNLSASLESLERIQNEKGWSDEQIDAGMELLANIAKDFIVGKITPETMQMAFNAINHDIDVAAAEEEAEIRGRNTKIEEKLRKKKSGDGTASLDGKNGSAKPSRPQRDLGALDNFGDNNKNIWERGGEKRRKA